MKAPPSRLEEINAIKLTPEEEKEICRKAILEEKAKRWHRMNSREYWEEQEKKSKHVKQIQG